jgi:hypothetical protein
LKSNCFQVAQPDILSPQIEGIDNMSAFHKFFDIQPVSNITNPEPTYQKSKSKAPQTLGDVGVLPDVELTDFASRNTDNGRQASVSEFDMPKGAQTPKTPNELEMSRPATPTREDAVGRERMWNAEPMTKWRILCCCMIYFSNGINDSGMEDCESELTHHFHGTKCGQTLTVDQLLAL